MTFNDSDATVMGTVTPGHASACRSTEAGRSPVSAVTHSAMRPPQSKAVGVIICRSMRIGWPW